MTSCDRFCQLLSGHVTSCDRSRDAVEPAPSIVAQREERRLEEMEGRGGEGGGGREQNQGVDKER